MAEAEQEKGPTLVEATGPGWCGGYQRREGDRFYIHGHENFNPGWMVEVKVLEEQPAEQSAE